MGPVTTVGWWLLLWAGAVLTGWLLRQARRPAATVRLPLLPAPPRFAAALADAGVPGPPGALVTWWVAGSACLVGLALVGAGVGAAVVIGGACAGAPVVALAATGGRALRAVDVALPDFLDGVARSLRSGVTLHAALDEAAADVGGRLGVDVEAVLAETEGGVPLAAALDRWPAACPTPGVRLAAAALALAAEAGGASARAVDGVAATVRANQSVEAEVRAQSSQAWLSALVIGLSPLAFTALAAGTDARTLGFLLGSPIGLTCLAVGLTLDGIALWWMRRLTASVG